MIKGIDLWDNLNHVDELYNPDDVLYVGIYVVSAGYDKNDIPMFKLSVEGMDLDGNTIERELEIRTRYFWKDPETEIEYIIRDYKENSGLEPMLFEAIKKNVKEDWDFDKALESVEITPISDYVFVAKFTEKNQEVSYYEFIVTEVKDQNVIKCKIDI